MKESMKGLLEPKGNLLNHYGFFRTKNQIELLCIAYRELLEKIIPAREYYFGKERNRLEAIYHAFTKSKLLLKNHYFKQSTDP